MKIIIKFEKLFMQLSLIIMSALAFIQVISRYFLKIPNVWIEETTRYFMVWLVFIGMAAAAREDLHLKVDLLSLYSHTAAKVTNIAYKILLIVFGIFLCVQSWKVISFQFELGQTSSGMQIPMGFVYIGLLLGGGLFVTHMISQLLIPLIDKLSKNKEKEKDN